MNFSTKFPPGTLFVIYYPFWPTTSWWLCLMIGIYDRVVEGETEPTMVILKDGMIQHHRCSIFGRTGSYNCRLV